MNSGFTSHQHKSDTKTGPDLGLKSYTKDQRSATPELVDLGVMDYIIAASICELVNSLELFCISRFDAPTPASYVHAHPIPLRSRRKVLCVYITCNTNIKIKHVLFTFKCMFYNRFSLIAALSITVAIKSRKEIPQKLTQLSSRSHPRHLMGKRTAQKDTIIYITSDSQLNSNFPYR